jgi:uncharacterized protein (TIGR02246 family)
MIWIIIPMWGARPASVRHNRFCTQSVVRAYWSDGEWFWKWSTIMSSLTDRSQTSNLKDESAIRKLYQQLLDGWNKRSAIEFASLFAETGRLIGFDGSQYAGRTEIEAEISKIFADHMTATYVSKIREIRLFTQNVAILRAVAGMRSPGQSKLNPNVNAIQTLTALKHKRQWQIELFQNTPAQFHGRPELAQQLTEELSQLE